MLSTLLPDLVAQVGRVKDKAVETIRKARELIGKVKDDDESKEKFKNALATLEKRNLCLDMATCIDDESTLGSSAQAALHKIKWKDFIQQPSFKTAYDASKEVEPYAKVFQVICLSQLYLDAENPECNSAEEVKEVRKVMKEKLDLYRGLTGKVSEQLSRLKHLFEKTVQVKIDTAATARLKEEEQNKKANMKAAAEAVKQSKAKVRQYSVIDASAAMAKDVKHFTKKDFLALQQLPSHPLIIDNMEIVLADNVQEALGTFVETEFKTSRSYTTSGRGAMMVEEPTQQAEVATQFGLFLGKDGGKLLDQLDRNEKNYINSPWFWAALRRCTPAGLSSQCSEASSSPPWVRGSWSWLPLTKWRWCSDSTWRIPERMRPQKSPHKLLVICSARRRSSSSRPWTSQCVLVQGLGASSTCPGAGWYVSVRSMANLS